MFVCFESVVAWCASWCYILTMTTSSVVIKSKLFKFGLGQKIGLGESTHWPMPISCKSKWHSTDRFTDDFSTSYLYGESILTTNEKVTSPTKEDAKLAAEIVGRCSGNVAWGAPCSLEGSFHRSYIWSLKFMRIQ